MTDNEAKALRVVLEQCYSALNAAPGFSFFPTTGNPCQFPLNPRSKRATSYDLAARVRFVLEQTK